MALAVSLPLAVLLALGSLHGCDRGAGMIDRDESSAGQPTTLQVGEQLRIRLAENVTTGYRWELGPECGSLLRQESDETAPPSTAAVGAGRERTWVFRAMGQGQCELRFEYARPWEKNATGRLVRFPVAVQRGD